jgi:hypothetical protein
MISFFLATLGFESGPCAYKQVLYHLNHACRKISVERKGVCVCVCVVRDGERGRRRGVEKRGREEREGEESRGEERKNEIGLSKGISHEVTQA